MIFIIFMAAMTSAVVSQINIDHNPPKIISNTYLVRQPIVHKPRLSTPKIVHKKECLEWKKN